MTTGETPGRSTARAHLSQLVDMFGTHGLLRISTSPEPDTADGGGAEDDAQSPGW